MANFTEDDLLSILNLADITGDQKKEALRVARVLMEEKKSEKEAGKAPRRKNQYIVVLKGPDELKDMEIVSSVFSCPEDQDPATLFDSIRAATVDSNCMRKKKKMELRKFSDIILLLKAKFQKPRNFKILTKEWCRTLVLDRDDAFIVGGSNNN
jgi:hypothetical protein